MREQKKNLTDRLVDVMVFLAYVFLLLPTVIVVLAAFNGGEYLHFPPDGFSLKWFSKLFATEQMMESFYFSLKLALAASVSSTLIGLGAALYVVRYSGRLASILRPYMLSPLMLPSILTGLALMVSFYSIGVGGKTFFGLYAGHTLITTPYVFLVVSSVLYNFDYSMEEAARNLGATRLQTFFYVTLPHIKNGIIGSGVFAFISSFDQFPLSLLLTGPGYSTLPVQMFDYLRFEFDPVAAAIATINIVLAYGMMFLMEHSIGLKTLYGGKK